MSTDPVAPYVVRHRVLVELKVAVWRWRKIPSDWFVPFPRLSHVGLAKHRLEGLGVADHR